MAKLCACLTNTVDKILFLGKKTLFLSISSARLMVTVEKKRVCVRACLRSTGRQTDKQTDKEGETGTQ